jgi:hypothetical protein
MAMILIISSCADNGVQRVCDWLDYYDQPFMIANEATPFSYSLCEGSIYAGINGQVLRPVEGGWIRNPYLDLGRFIPNDHSELAKWIGMDLQKNQEFLFHHFKNKLGFLGTPYPLDINKLQVFEQALAMNISVPPYAVVMEKGGLFEFVQQHRLVVTKSIGWNINLSIDGVIHTGYTRLLSQEDIASLPDRFMPSFIQKFVDAKFEIRSLLVDGRQFSMAQAVNHKDHIDSRARKSDGPCLPFALPEERAGLLWKLMQQVGLDLCVFDLLFADDDYWLIDVNPTGQFTRIGRNCHYPIESFIAQRLIARRNGQGY